MGLRGPKRKPTAQIESWLKGRRLETEPQFAAMVPEPPQWLPANVQAEYNDIAEILNVGGILSRNDGRALVAITTAYLDFRAAWERHQKSKGRQINSTLYATIKAREQFMKLAAHFGMSPSTRSEVQALPKKIGEILDKRKYLK